ncbi:hypothetical protein ACFTSF_09735 [Kribbella sp. NPDC056951]|uniref:hypothetical protein n=1 Tax=Kribbella sp. NPDC056951 TaxID=3345978 RepID=UPI003626DAF2
MVDDKAPHAVLVELIERLSGRWRVTGRGIEGEAEYKSMDAGRLLVASVDFVVNGTRMRVIQHITYDEDAAVLRADYMDTMGGKSIYTWTLDGKILRVSLGVGESDTYFEAAFKDDDSEYVGSWHYPDSAGDAAADERIVYKRIEH